MTAFKKRRKVNPMSFKPWQLAAMEEHGYTDTSTGLVNRVARYLANSPNDVIEPEEFRRACIACGVDPSSFTQSDINQLRDTLKRL